jgi:hypothetical protein
VAILLHRVNKWLEIVSFLYPFVSNETKEIGGERRKYMGSKRKGRPVNS